MLNLRHNNEGQYVANTEKFVQIVACVIFGKLLPNAVSNAKIMTKINQIHSWGKTDEDRIMFCDLPIETVVSSNICNSF